MTRHGTGLLLCAALVAVASNASAQVVIGRETPRAGSVEVSGGVTWAGEFTSGTTAAELTQNSQTVGGFDLFQTSGRLERGTGATAAVSYYLSRSLALEGGAQYSRPRLTYRLSGDFEDAEPVTATETMTRYVFTGSVVWHLRGLTFARRAVPFLAAGAGYIRDLHEKNELIETGTEYHAAGGVTVWFGAARPRFGLRAQAGVSISDGGFDFKDEPRTLPVASAVLVYLF